MSELDRYLIRTKQDPYSQWGPRYLKALDPTDCAPRPITWTDFRRDALVLDAYEAAAIMLVRWERRDSTWPVWVAERLDD